MTEEEPEPRLATVLHDLATGETIEVPYGSPLYGPSMDWARFHGIDPMAVPAGTTIVRDAERCRVLYEEFVYDPPERFADPGAIVLLFDEDGEPYDALAVCRWTQSEAPPLPFPR